MYNAEMLFSALVLRKKLLKDQMAQRITGKEKDSWLFWKTLNKLPYDFISSCLLEYKTAWNSHFVWTLVNTLKPLYTRMCEYQRSFNMSYGGGIDFYLI